MFYKIHISYVKISLYVEPISPPFYMKNVENLKVTTAFQEHNFI